MGGGMIVQQMFNSFCGGVEGWQAGLHTHSRKHTLNMVSIRFFPFILITEKYENIYIYIESIGAGWVG